MPALTQVPFWGGSSWEWGGHACSPEPRSLSWLVSRTGDSLLPSLSRTLVLQLLSGDGPRAYRWFERIHVSHVPLKCPISAPAFILLGSQPAPQSSSCSCRSRTRDPTNASVRIPSSPSSRAEPASGPETLSPGLDPAPSVLTSDVSQGHAGSRGHVACSAALSPKLPKRVSFTLRRNFVTLERFCCFFLLTGPRPGAHVISRVEVCTGGWRRSHPSS